MGKYVGNLLVSIGDDFIGWAQQISDSRRESKREEIGAKSTNACEKNIKDADHKR